MFKSENTTKKKTTRDRDTGHFVKCSLETDRRISRPSRYKRDTKAIVLGKYRLIIKACNDGQGLLAHNVIQRSFSCVAHHCDFPERVHEKPSKHSL